MRVDFLQGYDLVYFAILAGQQAAVTSTVCQSVPPTAKEAGSTKVSKSMKCVSIPHYVYRTCYARATRTIEVLSRTRVPSETSH